MQGKILKGIGGLYFVMDGEGNVHQLRAQGKLRREHMKPLAGDEVELQPGNGEEDGWITAILPRRTVLVRPPVANIDTVLIVAAAASPDPDLAMIDRLIFNARLAGITPVMAVTKTDLDPDMARSIVRQYTGAEVEATGVCSRTGEGLDELKAMLRGLYCRRRASQRSGLPSHGAGAGSHDRPGAGHLRNANKTACGNSRAVFHIQFSSAVPPKHEANRYH